MVVVEAKLVVDAVLAALDIAVLKDFELEAEVGSPVMEDEVLLELVLAAGEGDEMTETVDTIETVETIETVAVTEDDGAAELGTTTGPVLVC